MTNLEHTVKALEFVLTIATATLDAQREREGGRPDYAAAAALGRVSLLLEQLRKEAQR